MDLGDAFLMPLPGQDIDHLFFVISDPASHQAFIIVNVTKDGARAGYECEMLPGTSGRTADHPWIKEKCYVNFSDAEEITKEKAKVLIGLLQRGFVKPQPRLRLEVLRRIVEAAKKSKVLAVALKRYLPP